MPRGPSSSGHHATVPMASWVLMTSGAPCPPLRIELQAIQLLSCDPDWAQHGAHDLPRSHLALCLLASLRGVGRGPRELAPPWPPFRPGGQSALRIRTWPLASVGPGLCPSLSLCLSLTVSSCVSADTGKYSDCASLSHGVSSLTGGRKINP